MINITKSAARFLAQFLVRSLANQDTPRCFELVGWDGELTVKPAEPRQGVTPVFTAAGGLVVIDDHFATDMDGRTIDLEKNEIGGKMLVIN